MIYVSNGNKIIKEVLVKGIRPEEIVTGLGNVADIAYDDTKQIIYYIDGRNGRIEQYDLKRKEKKRLYEDLDKPTKLTLDISSR